LKDPKTVVWQVHECSTGKLLKRFDDLQEIMQQAAFLSDGIELVLLRFLPDAGPLGSRGMMELQVLDTQSGNVLRRSKQFTWSADGSTKQSAGGVRDLCISPDGKRIAIGNGGATFPDEACIILFDSATLKKTARFHEPHAWQTVFGLEFLDK